MTQSAHLTVFWFSGCINLSFAYVEGESLLMALKDVALSSGRSDTLEALFRADTDDDLCHLCEYTDPCPPALYF